MHHPINAEHFFLQTEKLPLQALDEKMENANLVTASREKSSLLKVGKKLSQDLNVNKCIKCEKSFSTRSHLLFHLKICGQSKDKIRSLMLSCDLCEFKTVYKSNLSAHKKTKHLPQDSNKNKCSKCKKNFSERSSLLAHLKICGHLDVVKLLKRYICDHCDYRSSFKSNLAAHIRTRHLPRDSSANKCSRCKKSFSHRSNLLAHLKICGRSEDDIDLSKCYTCDHCNYKNVHKGNLAKHIKAKHLPRDLTENKCTKCDKNFLQRSTLLEHSKICGKSEKFKCSFIRHKCKQCDYRTNRKGHLSRHVQTIHSDY